MSNGAPPPKTYIITGISAHSPLSQQVAATLATLTERDPNTSIAVALLGPSLPYIQQVIQTIEPKSLAANSTFKTLPLEVDLTSAQSIALASHTIRSDLGAWDKFIHNAPAHLSLDSPQLQTTIRGSDEDEWWNAFVINVRSLHLIARHFFPKAKGNSTFLSILEEETSEPTAGGGVGSGATDKNKRLKADDKMSALTASSAAAAEVVRYLHQETIGTNCDCIYVKQLGGSSQDDAAAVVESLG